MLTVKLVEPNGHEQLYEVEKVWVEPAGNGAHQVFFSWKSAQEDYVTSCFGSNGIVYVMNSGGKTIARYTLPITEEYRAHLTGEETNEKYLLKGL